MQVRNIWVRVCCSHLPQITLVISFGQSDVAPCVPGGPLKRLHHRHRVPGLIPDPSPSVGSRGAVFSSFFFSLFHRNCFVGLPTHVAARSVWFDESGVVDMIPADKRRSSCPWLLLLLQENWTLTCEHAPTSSRDAKTSRFLLSGTHKRHDPHTCPWPKQHTAQHTTLGSSQFRTQILTSRSWRPNSAPPRTLVPSLTARRGRGSPRRPTNSACCCVRALRVFAVEPFIETGEDSRPSTFSSGSSLPSRLHRAALGTDLRLPDLFEAGAS